VKGQLFDIDLTVGQGHQKEVSNVQAEGKTDQQSSCIAAGLV
jgi:hypothetical protein